MLFASACPIARATTARLLPCAVTSPMAQTAHAGVESFGERRDSPTSIKPRASSFSFGRKLVFGDIPTQFSTTETSSIFLPFAVVYDLGPASPSVSVASTVSLNTTSIVPGTASIAAIVVRWTLSDVFINHAPLCTTVTLASNSVAISPATSTPVTPPPMTMTCLALAMAARSCVILASHSSLFNPSLFFIHELLYLLPVATTTPSALIWEVCLFASTTRTPPSLIS
mmetsp:Transcript_44871/g.105259  ORF Transcript_44871/g.105259 Transcript_44871/m.105259 type:complete len:227 (-) Transcript_44871:301-981(-)